MRTALFLVPEGLDDPSRPSGGNHYDRQVADGLQTHGWNLRPATPPSAAGELDRQPDGAVVVIDGLVAPDLAPVLTRHAQRLRLVLLLHMPAPSRGERAVARASQAVVTTSGWTRDIVRQRYGLPDQRLRVVHPGVDHARITVSEPSGRRLLSVAAVRPHKGHDVLLQALAMLGQRDWECTCVGARDVEPGFAALVDALPARPRVRFPGAMAAAELDAAYRSSDVLVVPSRTEAYGMVVTEALARGLPVIASNVGGIAEALGVDRRGRRPGILVKPADPDRLAQALRAWLDDEDLRHRLRAACRDRRSTLPGWDATAAQVAEVLLEVAA